MAIFNFFSSKPSSSNTPSQGNQVVVFDMDALESKNVNWNFLDSFENPELWIFTSNKENEKLKELEQKYLIKTFSLPEDTRQSPFWILGMVLFDLLTLNLKDTHKITMVATLPYYEAISEYLKLKGISIEFLLVEATINKLPKLQSLKLEKTQAKPQDVALNNKTTGSDSSSTEKKVANKKNKKRKQIIIKELNPEELQKICNAFQEHFELEGIYEKKALGEIVKIATGKTLHKVFHTRNAKLYVGCLYQNGIIENINENDFKLLKYPTVDVFPKEVKVIRKKFSRNKNRKKNNS